MPGIVKHIITIIVVMLMLPVSWASYVMWRDWYYKAPQQTPQQTEVSAKKKCYTAEAAEGAASQNDQVLVVKAAMRVSKDRNLDPCWIFTRYTLMRAPSQEKKLALLRDPDFVAGKGGWFQAAASRVATATIVVDQALKGDFQFVPGEPQEVELARRRILDCVEKFKRVWPINTARTDADAMQKEMGQSWTSPAGTVFYCPK